MTEAERIERAAEAVSDLLKAGKIMLICQECSDNFPEGCGHFSAETLRVAPDGRWVCQSCYDESIDDDERWWQDLPAIPLSAAEMEG